MPKRAQYLALPEVQLIVEVMGRPEYIDKRKYGYSLKWYWYSNPKSRAVVNSLIGNPIGITARFLDVLNTPQYAPYTSFQRLRSARVFVPFTAIAE